MSKLIAGWLCIAVAAAEPLVTDRPDFTESAVTVAPGRVQLELGWTYSEAAGDHGHTVGELLVRAGVTPRGELRLELPSYEWTRGAARTAGFGDAGIGAKYAVGLQRGASPELALIVACGLPSRSPVSAGGLEPSATLAAAWELTPRVGLGANLGLGAPLVAGTRFGQLTGSLACGLALTQQAGLFVEWYGLFPAGPGAGVAHYLDGGATYLLGHDLQLDARAGLGLNGGGEVFVGLGLSVRR